MRQSGIYNKRFLLVFVVMVIIGGLAFIILGGSKKDTTNDPYTYKDEDTGEIISVQPGVNPEGFNSEENEPFLIGLTSLANFGSISLTANQLPILRNDLVSKGVKSLGEYDETIKILNPRLDPETFYLEADLLYKEGVDTALIIFDIPNEYVFQYTIQKDGAEVYKSIRLLIDGITEEPPL